MRYPGMWLEDSILPAFIFVCRLVVRSPSTSVMGTKVQGLVRAMIVVLFYRLVRLIWPWGFSME